MVFPTSRSFQAELERYSAQLTRIEAELEKARPAVREELRREMHALEERREKTGAYLAELRLKSAQSWAEEDFWAATRAALDEIGKRIDRLLSRLR